MQRKQSPFKTYDIRGIYPSVINEDFFYSIGKSLGQLNIKEIAVGRDARLSSDSLYSSLISGLLDSDIKIIDLGVLSSPMLSFFCVKKLKFGAMITASHNPKDYNGIKFIDKSGIQLSYQEFLKKIEKVIKNLKYKKNDIKDVKKYQVLDEYISYMQERFSLVKDAKTQRKIVFDCSNGVASIPLLPILKELKINNRVINAVPDGNFPAHSSDTTIKENLIQLQREVVKSNADLGIMYDGDEDRCVFVDEKGDIVPNDIAFIILALYELQGRSGRFDFLFDLRFSKVVSESIKNAGSNPIVMRVGNPFYKKALHKRKKAILAGELSGHIMYKENYGIDDPIYASLKMIDIINNSKIKFSQMISKYKKYYSTGEVDIKCDNPKKAINIISNKYKKSKRLTIDGLSVIEKEFWFNIRPSNTEPLIRLIVEGHKKEEVEKVKKEIINWLK